MYRFCVTIIVCLIIGLTACALSPERLPPRRKLQREWQSAPLVCFAAYSSSPCRRHRRPLSPACTGKLEAFSALNTRVTTSVDSYDSLSRTGSDSEAEDAADYNDEQHPQSVHRRASSSSDDSEPVVTVRDALLLTGIGDDGGSGIKREESGDSRDDNEVEVLVPPSFLVSLRRLIHLPRPILIVSGPPRPSKVLFMAPCRLADTVLLCLERAYRFGWCSPLAGWCVPSSLVS